MNSAEQLDATFAALADPTRRAILARLSLGEATVSELCEPFSISQPAISKHLTVLERAGLVSRGGDRHRRPVRLEAKPMAEAVQWLEAYRTFWATRFDALDELLDDLQPAKKAPKPSAKQPSKRSSKRSSKQKRA
jgi:DNA-binding transcriptional ArsR family regulator